MRRLGVAASLAVAVLALGPGSIALAGSTPTQADPPPSALPTSLASSDQAAGYRIERLSGEEQRAVLADAAVVSEEAALAAVHASGLYNGSVGGLTPGAPTVALRSVTRLVDESGEGEFPPNALLDSPAWVLVWQGSAATPLRGPMPQSEEEAALQRAIRAELRGHLSCTLVVMVRASDGVLSGGEQTCEADAEAKAAVDALVEESQHTRL